MLSCPHLAAGPPGARLARTMVGSIEPQPDSTITTPRISPGARSKLTAGLLGIFLGGLGVHRFYLGYTGIGIAKLLTFGGCGIWALVDLILIAMRNVPDSDGRPLS